MRKTPLIMAATMLLLSCSNLALGFDPMGPPKAMLSQGQPGWRIEYLYSTMNVEAGGAFGVPAATIKDVKMNKIYANVGYGLNDRWEVFARLGVTNTDIDQGANANPLNLGSFMGNSDFDLSIGAGTRVTFFESDDVSLGLLAQISFAEIDSFDGNNAPPNFSTRLRITEIQIALGPTWNCAEGLSIYGGPFLHLIDGNAEMAAGGFQASIGIEQDAIFGGYIGAGIRLFESPNITCNIEFQGTGAGYAAAIQLAIAY